MWSKTKKLLASVKIMKIEKLGLELGFLFKRTCKQNVNLANYSKQNALVGRRNN